MITRDDAKTTVRNEHMEANYFRARELEHEAANESMALNTQIHPAWIGQSNVFWYIRKTRSSINGVPSVGREFRLVDADARLNKTAFDHNKLAKLLQKVTNQRVSAEALPVRHLTIEDLFYVNGEVFSSTVVFMSFGKQWKFDTKADTCVEITEKFSDGILSPDGSKLVFLRAYNLWCRDIESGREMRLTEDGEKHNAYGALPERISLTNRFDELPPLQPEVLWSPDSKNVLTIQTDERKVKSIDMSRYIHGDKRVRPHSVQIKYALPGDEYLAEYRFLSINVETGCVTNAKYPRILDTTLFASPFSGGRVWWSKTSDIAYFVHTGRGQKSAHVVSFDTKQGISKIIFEERSPTYIDLNLDYENPASLFPISETNELIWLSERTGWAHLYLYDLATGELKNAITSGDWVVREVLQFDSKNREVFIQLSGRIADRDPYYREICRVNVDSGEIFTLASSDHDYFIHKPFNLSNQIAAAIDNAPIQAAGVAPTNQYMVVTRSRVDEPPVTELRDRNGRLILNIEVADVLGLPESWEWPEPVKLKADDGKTDIYGVMYKPSYFNPKKQYPVLDIAINNPSYSLVPKGSFLNGGYMYMSAAAHAELGFIVLIIDGRGSPYRSKSFHDEAYGHVHQGSNLSDHVAGINQLAERCSYMDIDCVGITDINGSNAPIYGLFEFPEFYKVGSVTSIPDPRFLLHSETYLGLPSEADYEHCLLEKKANNLKGKLLLIHGMADPYYHLGGLLQLIEALIQVNKDFDLILLPSGGHCVTTSHYGLRQSWDYLVKHLIKTDPPVDFYLSSGVEVALGDS